jgi:hypothetical protein
MTSWIFNRAMIKWSPKKVNKKKNCLEIGKVGEFMHTDYG